MNNYTWAANLTKLRRAEAQCGKEATEEMVLEAYRKMGGLVMGNGPIIKVDLEAEVTTEVTPEVKETPKKKDKK